jgi:glycerol-3-phosphate O-acyltransferase
MPRARSKADVRRAVLARAEVVKLIEHGRGREPARVREQILAYIRELQTTQRYQIYRVLPSFLYPILRKIPRHVEHIDLARDAVRSGRVIYASNHRSHMDYVVEPTAIDRSGIRPPLIAAGINLFGGPLGLLHRHVTGAIPIRRNTRDPVYLTTLKAFVAERLHDHDLLMYPEGGRSYSGELKPYKTGLLHAALQGGVKDLLIVPTAIAYDLVLEDRVIAAQGVKRRQRPFRHELAEMMGLAMGYQSRAFIVFGHPVPAGTYDPESRSDALELARLLRETTGKLVKVLPTAIVATAMHPSITPAELEARIASRLDSLIETGANLAVRDIKHAMEDGLRRLEHRGVIQSEPGRIRVRDRNVLRYYARSIQHLLPPAS